MPAIRYAPGAGGVDIAFTEFGEGSLWLVYVPGFISHLELAPEIPVFAALMDRLARFARVLTFDKRGTGLSDRELGFGSFDERTDDIRAVMDAAGWADAAPTLVVHQSGDPIVNFLHGRELASDIPHATLVQLDGSIHCGWTLTDWAPALDAVEQFVTGAPPAAPPPDRVLATVLFTDIVDSTRRAAALGDREWRSLLDQHDALSRRTVERYGGRLQKHTGDGLLATFDGPGRAVLCARTMNAELETLQLHIRSGLHTGEIERRGDDVAGIGVHIAARIAALAGPHEVLVSRTGRDLVVGSDLAFEARGTYELKGVPDAWQLYAAR